MREAFELALDRDGIVQVAMDGEADAGNQWVAPTQPVLREERADARSATSRAPRRCCKEAGVPNPSFTLMTPTTSDAQRIAQVVQAMAQRSRLRREDPVDRVRDLAQPGRQGPVRGLRARLERPRRSRRQPLQLRRAASSRSTTPATASRRSTSCSTSRARRATRPSARSSSSRSRRSVLKDRPIVYLYHRHWLWAYTSKLDRPAHRSPTAWCACRA